MKKPKAKSVRAWAIKKKNRLSAYEIYFERPEMLNDDEEVCRVEIREI